MELQVGVKVLLKNNEGKYLLMRRNLEKYPEITQWDIPGGRIDPRTTLIENLAREVMEETALTIQKTPRLVAAQDILKVPGRHVVRLTYTSEADGEPKLSDEHDEYRWFTTGEMQDNLDLDHYVRELLEDARILKDLNMPIDSTKNR